jgi:hypothetical protein
MNFSLLAVTMKWLKSTFLNEETKGRAPQSLTLWLGWFLTASQALRVKRVFIRYCSIKKINMGKEICILNYP